MADKEHGRESVWKRGGQKKKERFNVRLVNERKKIRETMRSRGRKKELPATETKGRFPPKKSKNSEGGGGRLALSIKVC